MKTYIKYGALCLLLVGQALRAQSLGQDAEGYSSIITRTATFNLDIANDLAVFAYYSNTSDTSLTSTTEPTYIEFMFSDNQENMEGQINSVDAESKKDFNGKHRYMTWGADFKGSLSNGNASIFSNGRLASSGVVNGLVGYNWDRMNFKPNTRKLVTKRIAYNNFHIKDAETAIKVEVRRLINAGTLNEGQMTHYVDVVMSKKDIKKRIIFIDSRLESLKERQHDSSGKTSANQEQLKRRDTLLNLLLAKSKNRVMLPKNTEEKLAMPTDSIVKIDKFKKEMNTILDNKVLEGLGLNRINNAYQKDKWTKLQEDVENKIFENNIALALIDTSVINDYKRLIAFYENYRDMLNDYQKTEEDYYKELGTHVMFNRHLLYVRAGFTGSSFKYDYGRDSTTVRSRFKTRNFDGYKIDVGYTGQYNLINYLGLGASVGYTNNVGDLNPGTYTLTTKDTTITSGDFTSSETVKALSGFYDQFVRYDLNADFVHLFTLNEERENDKGELYLSLNPYLRYHIYQHSETLKNRMVFGIGAYAYSSKDNKILGGLFVQSSDVFGNNSANAGTFKKRVQFGVVARFAFTGLKLKK